MTEEDIKANWLACSESPAYFIHNFCLIEDPLSGGWIPFSLWPAQLEVVQEMTNNQLVLVMKARQLGLSWISLGYALWMVLFRSSSQVLIFSRRDDEAVYLLDDRLKGMYNRLPAWLQADEVVKDSGHIWELSNGSTVRAFPTSGGDSYTASLAIVDEADLVKDLARLLGSVKPTIDAGGQLFLVSRVDKSRPNSEFKRIYRASQSGQNSWRGLFLPWYARPDRTQDWYELQRRDIQAREGTLDTLWEQYPATAEEALAPRSLDKRIPPKWLEAVLDQRPPLEEPGLVLPGLFVFEEPQPGRRYFIGADPAEGNPTSDPSASSVLDAETGAQVAVMAGQLQPSTFAYQLAKLALYYNQAQVLVERNNHGHAVLLWLQDNSVSPDGSRTALKYGEDGKIGWLSNSKGKALMYTSAADGARDKSYSLRDYETYLQLLSIEGSTLRAPEGSHDDRADALALAETARSAAIDWLIS